jgi:hypothetical protein
MTIVDGPFDSSIAQSPNRQQSLNRQSSFGNAGLGACRRREGGSLTPCFGYRRHHHPLSRAAHDAARSNGRGRGIVLPPNHLACGGWGDRRAERVVVVAAVEHHG